MLPIPVSMCKYDDENDYRIGNTQSGVQCCSATLFGCAFFSDYPGSVDNIPGTGFLVPVTSLLKPPCNSGGSYSITFTRQDVKRY